MKVAEKKCGKLLGGKIPWSPEVTVGHLVIVLWTLVVRRLKGCHVSASTILHRIAGRISRRHQRYTFRSICSAI